MKYDINRLRSWGLRFIVRDQYGQLWASERKPVRSKGYWRIADEFLPPKRPDECRCYIDNDTHTVQYTNPELLEDYIDRYRQHYRYYSLVAHPAGRMVFEPLSDCPFDITWEDEPFDLVANGIVPEADMKTWPDPPRF